MTAKLSRRFYEQFGDDLTNELVDWFNSVDATYQSDLRELNEVNFARFDAKLDQRLGALDAKWDQRIGAVERRIDIFEARLDERFALFKTRITHWMFGLWTGTMLAMAGLLIAVLRPK